MQGAATYPIMQRSHGQAWARFGAIGGRTRLQDLRQIGCAKAIMPRVSGDVPEVVFLNTSGGITDSDTLHYGIELGAGGHLTATTQTAERAYAGRGAAGCARFEAQIGAGARFDWLPQETILYENSHLNRSTVIDLAADATCLLCESVVLGRHAMGEMPARARLSDMRMIRRAGRPTWAETIQIGSDFLAQKADAALLGSARVFAVIALVGPGATDALPALRATLNEPDTESAASAWDGKCIARILARDGWPLKRQVSRALEVLRQAPLPRVWQLQGA